jgi:hypothetical protein
MSRATPPRRRIVFPTARVDPRDAVNEASGTSQAAREPPNWPSSFCRSISCARESCERIAKTTADAGAGSPRARRMSYVSPLHWTFYAEILVVAYCVTSAAILINTGEGLWAIPLVFWAVCMGLVAQLQMVPRLA